LQIFGIPGWVSITMILLAAAIFVGAKIAAAEKAGRQKPEMTPVPANVRRAMR